MDLTFGTIYCAACSDCRYDSDLEQLMLGNGNGPSSASETPNHYFLYFSWEPSITDLNLILKNGDNKPRKLMRISENSFIGN